MSAKAGCMCMSRCENQRILLTFAMHETKDPRKFSRGYHGKPISTGFLLFNRRNHNINSEDWIEPVFRFSNLFIQDEPPAFTSRRFIVSGKLFTNINQRVGTIA